VKRGMPGSEKHSGGGLSGKLLAAFSLLSQAGKRFVSYIGEGRDQGSESAKVVEVTREAARVTSGGLEMHSREQRQEREGTEEMTPLLASS
jgi:hypothetical protein